MPFPEGWPPRAVSSKRGLRFYRTGTSTASFEDNAWFFGSSLGAHQPLPYVKPGSLDPVFVGTVAGGGRDPRDTALGERPGIPITCPRFCLVFNDEEEGGGVLQVSWDGVDVHMEVFPQQEWTVEDILEGGISVRTRPGDADCAFRVVAW
jgi:hypothetical protein